MMEGVYTNGKKTIKLVKRANGINKQIGFQTYVDGVKNMWIDSSYVEKFLKHNLGNYWNEKDLVC